MRVADGDVSDLAIHGQIAKENEVAESALKRLRVQRGVEDGHVEACGRGDIGDDDVDVIDLRRVQGQQAALRLRLCRHRTNAGDDRGRAEAGDECASRNAVLRHGPAILAGAGRGAVAATLRQR